MAVLAVVGERPDGRVGWVQWAMRRRCLRDRVAGVNEPASSLRSGHDRRDCIQPGLGSHAPDGASARHMECRGDQNAKPIDVVRYAPCLGGRLC